MTETATTTWVIGDIHGMVDPLRALINHLDNTSLAKFVFTGDYIDHGPSSKAVLDLIMELGDQAIPLIGNHEHLLLQTLFDADFRERWGTRIWEENAAEATVRSFGCRTIAEFAAKVEPRYLDFLKNLQCFHQEIYGNQAETIRFLMVHGGIMPTIPLADQLAIQDYQAHNRLMAERKLWIEESFIWIRTDFFEADPHHWDGYIVIHGHTPTQLLRHTILGFDEEKEIDELTQLYLRTHPVDLARTVSIDIDTGAAFGNRLTAIGLNPSALEAGWFHLPVVQLDLQQGYYRTNPLRHHRMKVKAFPKNE
ncbi:MAG: serine/threonine protein phosphatase [Caldilineaceae bacterium]|nr:serine/threonine protein phosphatase [Caldilineaceae bacterium]